MNKNKKMPKKHKPLPPKAQEEEEEEEEEISTPISSQPFSQKPNSNKPSSHPNQTHKPHTASSSSSEEVEEEGEEEEEEISTPISSQPFSQKPNSNKPTFHSNQTHKAQTASSSSSEDVEEEEIDREEDDEETEDSEIEKTKYIATLSKPTQPTKQKEQEEEEDSDYEQDSASGSSSNSSSTKQKEQEEEEDSDYEQDSASDSSSKSSSQSPKSNKPISSKKIDRHPKPKKPQTSSDGAAPSRKRPQAAAEANENGLKKQKLGACNKAGVKSKQPGFYWRPEDKITVLKGMMEFAERGYSDASSDKNGFHRFINKLLTVKVTRRQLDGKIKSMRWNYRTQLKKAREGMKPIFSKPQDKLEYQLSKKVWGENDPTLEDDDDGNDDIEVENGNGVDTLNTEGKVGGIAKKRMSTREKKCGGNVKRRQKNSQNDDVENEAVLYPHLKELLPWSGIARVSGLSESDVKRAFQLMSPSQVKELDLQWRNLQLKERDIHMERLNLAYDLTKQFYDLVKSSEV